MPNKQDKLISMPGTHVSTLLVTCGLFFAVSCKTSAVSSDATTTSSNSVASASLSSSTSANVLPARADEGSADTFSAVLIFIDSKQPVPSARLFLAPKTAGKLECKIDTALTGLSDEHGEVRIHNTKPGEYVVFYNLTGSIDSTLNKKVISYDPTNYGELEPPEFISAMRRSLGVKGIDGLTSGKLTIVNGHMVIGGYYYMHEPKHDLGIIAVDGALLTVHMPNPENGPAKIEVAPIAKPKKDKKN
jgi:hypothetical protein